MSSKIFKYISIYISSGAYKDPIKSKLIHCIKNIYPGCTIKLLSANSDAMIAFATSEIIKKSDLVIIWNGMEVGCFWVSEICKTFNIPYCIIERGLFPQSPTNFIVDRSGICCRSESINEKYLDKSKLPELNAKILSFYNERNLKYKIGGDKYLFIFQLEFDSTVYHFSNYKSNEDMVDKFVSKHKICPSLVLVCPHPRNPNVKSKYKISKNKTIVECQTAKLVIGISSTTMYEALGMGCPIKILGGNKNLIHPINRTWSNENLIIPTILQNQFDISEGSFSITKKIEKNSCNTLED